MINAITGRDVYLYDSLIKELKKAEEIKIIVSFLRESGAQLLVRDLKKQALKGADIKILTSRYLNITEPSAIYLLKNELGDLAELKFFDDEEISFHPKAYFFKNETEDVLYIGSSNISFSALHYGVEWNYRLQKEKDRQAFDNFLVEFNDLYDNYSIPISDKVLKKYADDWKKPSISREIDKKSYIKKSKEQILEKEKPHPRGAQIEALYELELAREEGISEGIVAAATGVGKTYLAAFDSIDYDKVLFVAHREEILKQAADTYLAIKPNKKISFFNGQNKDKGGEVVFASVQTLHNERYLEEYFSQTEFNYIIIDEFHHAAADSYLSVLSYFEADFMLGLTATPYRMDNKDIFDLCNNNLIYDLDLRTAINRDLLVPFRYFGIYDQEVDYEEINYQNGKYNSKELEKALSTHKRADLILDNYKKHAGARTIGFCASIKHAEYMADYFNQNQIKAVCVHSSNEKGPYYMDRNKAVKKLKNKGIEIIFAVDIFNEGVDIPALDTVLFLRPTESYVVFLQQLGRGLRKYHDKEYLKVLDFIGNYKRAHYLPLLLSGQNPMEFDSESYQSSGDFEYPEQCQVNLDLRLINLFEEMKENDPLETRMKDEYFRLKDYLSRRPMRLDIYNGSDIEVKNYLKSRYYKKGYLRFLAEIGEINDIEKAWLDTIVEEFLLELENTRMSKLYKIPVLLSLLEDGELKAEVSIEEVGLSFMNFYKNNKRFQKDLNNKKHKGWKNWDKKRFIREARINPVKYLSKKKYFIYDEINKKFLLHEDIKSYLSHDLSRHFKDIVDFRKMRYYNNRLKNI
ncbi:type III restriction protein res subunit [Halanaerobium hydrogeniformans]|uniref:Type III restriction protein res subunit n=2 Tax=Halanaerobium hydrogeniformans TaxID=656519 RepID=E4RP11_HALHG|nr:type III restriction protein res subunit [Halanaerobium hydrogeniformans]